jgi:nicotinamidase-related amidase
MPHALIIIDQQQGIDSDRLGERNNPDAQNVMLEMLCFWRSRTWPVFHIKHRSKDPQSVFWPEQQGYNFKEQFEPNQKKTAQHNCDQDSSAGGEFVIEKTVPCAFTKNTLEQKLQSLAVDSIVVVGASTNNSVESTVRSAGNLGFSVIVVEQACFAFDKVDFSGVLRSAQQVHDMSLANLNNEYAKVLSWEQILAYI